MTQNPPRLSLAYYEPGRNEPCLCGSGIKFKKCCSNKYSSDAYQLFVSAFKSHNYDMALSNARYQFTWYLLCHKAHTLPWLQSGADDANKLLTIDIEALWEILENIHRCYYKLGKSNEFRNVIERVKHSIKDQRWDAKIIYSIALWNSFDRNDDNAAYHMLKKINISKCNDSDLLAFYLEVAAKKITFSESIEIANRIIANTKIESYILQYSVLKAIFSHLTCQHEDAQRMIDRALQRYRGLGSEEKSSYGNLIFACALELNGKLTDNNSLLVEAELNLRHMISEYNTDEFTPMYLADLYRYLGDCEESQSKHIEAIKSYYSSIEASPSELTKVFLVRSFCNSGDISKAKEILNSIQSQLLNEEGRYDLSVTWALVAASSQSTLDIEEAKTQLKSVSIYAPIFRQQRDELLIRLLETQPKNSSGIIRKIIKTLNSYVILNLKQAWFLAKTEEAISLS